MFVKYQKAGKKIVYFVKKREIIKIIPKIK